MSQEREGRYRDELARALATSGGHLSIGRGGWTLHYENCRLSGYLADEIKAAAIQAGVPVIDSRCAPFDVVAQLVVRGPMIAVNQAPSPRPWGSFAYAPLAAVAAAYRAAGAEVFNVPDSPEDDAVLNALEDGPLGALIEFWLQHVRTHGDREEPDD